MKKGFYIFIWKYRLLWKGGLLHNIRAQADIDSNLWMLLNWKPYINTCLWLVCHQEFHNFSLDGIHIVSPDCSWITSFTFSCNSSGVSPDTTAVKYSPNSCSSFIARSNNFLPCSSVIRLFISRSDSMDFGFRKTAEKRKLFMQCPIFTLSPVTDL